MIAFLLHNFKFNIQNQHSLKKIAIFLIERVIFTQKDEMVFRKWNVSGLRAFLAAKAGPSFSKLPTKQTSFLSEITLYSIFNENQRLQKILYCLCMNNNDLTKFHPQKEGTVQELFCKRLGGANMVKTLDDRWKEFFQ